MTSLTTITEPVQLEIPRIKASRFIATLAPASDEASATAVINKVRETWPDASHHAWAWRLDADRVRQSDDGEVTGTAGRPILDRLVGDDLEQVVLVVTRFYGGTKLGKGGLLRAYGAAARAALDASTSVTQVRTHTLVFRCGLELVGPLQGVLQSFDAEVSNTEWTHEATLTVLVPEDATDTLRQALINRAAGRVTFL